PDGGIESENKYYSYKKICDNLLSNNKVDFYQTLFLLGFSKSYMNISIKLAEQVIKREISIREAIEILKTNLRKIIVESPNYTGKIIVALLLLGLLSVLKLFSVTLSTLLYGERVGIFVSNIIILPVIRELYKYTHAKLEIESSNLYLNSIESYTYLSTIVNKGSLLISPLLDKTPISIFRIWFDIKRNRFNKSYAGLSYEEQVEFLQNVLYHTLWNDALPVINSLLFFTTQFVNELSSNRTDLRFNDIIQLTYIRRIYWDNQEKLIQDKLADNLNVEDYFNNHYLFESTVNKLREDNTKESEALFNEIVKNLKDAHKKDPGTALKMIKEQAEKWATEYKFGEGNSDKIAKVLEKYIMNKNNFLKSAWNSLKPQLKTSHVIGYGLVILVILLIAFHIGTKYGFTSAVFSVIISALVAVLLAMSIKALVDLIEFTALKIKLINEADKQKLENDLKSAGNK
ncbi:MAG: hypothetical protein ACPLX8_00500, partial [Nanopusillaceae archaeon]